MREFFLPEDVDEQERRDGRVAPGERAAPPPEGLGSGHQGWSISSQRGPQGSFHLDTHRLQGHDEQSG